MAVIASTLYVLDRCHPAPQLVNGTASPLGRMIRPPLPSAPYVPLQVQPLGASIVITPLVSLYSASCDAGSLGSFTETEDGSGTVEGGVVIANSVRQGTTGISVVLTFPILESPFALLNWADAGEIPQIASTTPAEITLTRVQALVTRP